MEMMNELMLGQSQHISPRLIQANYMLGLSSLELQQFIQREAYENPALEVAEQTTCPRCGTVLVDLVCWTCLRPRDVSEARPSDSSEAYFDPPTWKIGSAAGHDEDYDPLLHVAAGVPLADRLLVDLQMLLADAADRPIAEYLVGSLDGNGWLGCAVEEVALALGVEAGRVERVLGLLQSLEPPGIGARTLRECLLIQLAHLESQDMGHPHVRRILLDHFDDLARHRYRRIARALHVPVDDAVAACRFVRERLNPFPAQQDGGKLRTAPAEIPRYALPDVMITEDGEGELVATVVESRRYTVRISPQYQHIAQEVESHRARQMAERDREHVRHYVNQARRFVANLEQRRQTMQKISDIVVAYQPGFLRYGARHLRPLTRAVVAAVTGMHESTVSRATAGKFVMLPNGRVIPFSDFFTAALNPKEVIKGIIAQESDPLDDQQIAALLQEQGHVIARRTVAKYRDELGILPSALRR